VISCEEAKQKSITDPLVFDPLESMPVVLPKRVDQISTFLRIAMILLPATIPEFYTNRSTSVIEIRNSLYFT